MNDGCILQKTSDLNKLDVEFSVVIPVYNEQESLRILYSRLITAMDNFGRTYEIVFINDGSIDNTGDILIDLHSKRPDVIKVVNLSANYGQHISILAGFEVAACKKAAITLDADLQNPPEEIGKIIEQLDLGHDVVGSYRIDRKDLTWRLWVSNMHNWFRKKMIPWCNMKDEGCMLRGYKTNIVKSMVNSRGRTTFIPMLAMLYAINPIDVGVKHEERKLGKSHYNFYKLFRYNFDLIIGFSVVPLQLLTVMSIIISFFSALFFIYSLCRVIVIGNEGYLQLLFSILFFVSGIILFALGIFGEYLARIYQEALNRPRYVIKNILYPNNHGANNCNAINSVSETSVD